MAIIKNFHSFKRKEVPEKTADFQDYYLAVSRVLQLFLSKTAYNFLFVVINFKNGETKNIQLTIIPNNFIREFYVEIKYDLYYRLSIEFEKDNPDVFVSTQILKTNKLTNQHKLFVSIADTILHSDEYYFFILYSSENGQENTEYCERFFDEKNEKLCRCNQIFEEIVKSINGDKKCP